MSTHVPQSELTVFAKADARGSMQSFGIKRADRRGHMYIIGKTGTGKSTLLETLMMSDVAKGQGFAILDPHGDLVKKIRRQIPAEMADRVIDFDVSDRSTPYGFNPLGFMHVDKRPLAASGLVQAFKHLWMDSWGPRLEYILRNCLTSLLDFPNAKLTDIPKLLSDRTFRAKVIKFIRNEDTKNFWLDEFEKIPGTLPAGIDQPDPKQGRCIPPKRAAAQDHHRTGDSAESAAGGEAGEDTRALVSGFAFL